ncbi:unnamed protein product [Amoebophrya sp. A120]|nr:unnamed protein product [Amoebophrya sp. A120]|eukprot:GSA120T00008297001.1
MSERKKSSKAPDEQAPSGGVPPDINKAGTGRKMNKPALLADAPGLDPHVYGVLGMASAVSSVASSKATTEEEDDLSVSTPEAEAGGGLQQQPARGAPVRKETKLKNKQKKEKKQKRDRAVTSSPEDEEARKEKKKRKKLAALASARAPELVSGMDDGGTSSIMTSSVEVTSKETSESAEDRSAARDKQRTTTSARKTSKQIDTEVLGQAGHDADSNNHSAVLPPSPKTSIVHQQQPPAPTTSPTEAARASAAEALGLTKNRVSQQLPIMGQTIYASMDGQSSSGIVSPNGSRQGYDFYPLKSTASTLKRRTDAADEENFASAATARATRASPTEARGDRISETAVKTGAAVVPAPKDTIGENFIPASIVPPTAGAGANEAKGKGKVGGQNTPPAPPAKGPGPKPEGNTPAPPAVPAKGNKPSPPATPTGKNMKGAPVPAVPPAANKGAAGIKGGKINKAGAPAAVPPTEGAAKGKKPAGKNANSGWSSSRTASPAQNSDTSTGSRIKPPAVVSTTTNDFTSELQRKLEQRSKRKTADPGVEQPVASHPPTGPKDAFGSELQRKLEQRSKKNAAKDAGGAVILDPIARRPGSVGPTETVGVLQGFQFVKSSGSGKKAAATGGPVDTTDSTTTAGAATAAVDPQSKTTKTQQQAPPGKISTTLLANNNNNVGTPAEINIDIPRAASSKTAAGPPPIVPPSRRTTKAKSSPADEKQNKIQFNRNLIQPEVNINASHPGLIVDLTASHAIIAVDTAPNEKEKLFEVDPLTGAVNWKNPMSEKSMAAKRAVDYAAQDVGETKQFWQQMVQTGGNKTQAMKMVTARGPKQDGAGNKTVKFGAAQDYEPTAVHLAEENVADMTASQLGAQGKTVQVFRKTKTGRGTQAPRETEFVLLHLPQESQTDILPGGGPQRNMRRKRGPLSTDNLYGNPQSMNKINGTFQPTATHLVQTGRPANYGSMEPNSSRPRPTRDPSDSGTILLIIVCVVAGLALVAGIVVTIVCCSNYAADSGPASSDTATTTIGAAGAVSSPPSAVLQLGDGRQRGETERKYGTTGEDRSTSSTAALVPAERRSTETQLSAASAAARTDAEDSPPGEKNTQGQEVVPRAEDSAVSWSQFIQGESTPRTNSYLALKKRHQRRARTVVVKKDVGL